MGQTCSPFADVPLIGCIKKDGGDRDEQRARNEFDVGRNNNKSDSRLIELSEKTSKAITCAHLIGNIIRNYFESEDNKCDQIGRYSKPQSIDTKSILENIFIIGSAPRNYLLKRPINSIDIAINTRELIKIQSIHLRKYHKSEKSQQSNSNCILWRLYKNKFLNDNENDSSENDKNKKKYSYIADCNYILNASFIVNHILIQHISSLLRDKLGCHRNNITKIYDLQIIDEMLYPKYDSYNLDTVHFSIFDITDKTIVHKDLFGNISSQQRLDKMIQIHSKQRIQLKEIKTKTNEEIRNELAPLKGHHPTVSEDVSLSMSFSLAMLNNNTKLQRFDSLQTFQFRINDKPMTIDNNNNNNKNVLTIELPFYEIKLREVMKLMDFSINTLIIKMSDILEINKKNNKLLIEDDSKDSFGDLIPYINDDVTINYYWTKKIQNGLENYNALADFKKKQLTQPFIENSIEAHGINLYFWKIVRYGVLLNSWKIDKKLISIIKESYLKYLKDTLKDVTFWDKENDKENRKNYEIFVDMMFNNDICYNNSLKQYGKMLYVFSVFDVHSTLILIMAKNKNFRDYFVKSINNLSTSKKMQIIQLFSKQGYVTYFARDSVSNY